MALIMREGAAHLCPLPWQYRQGPDWLRAPPRLSSRLLEEPLSLLCSLPAALPARGSPPSSPAKPSSSESHSPSSPPLLSPPACALPARPARELLRRRPFAGTPLAGLLPPASDARRSLLSEPPFAALPPCEAARALRPAHARAPLCMLRGNPRSQHARCKEEAAHARVHGSLVLRCRAHT